MTRVQLENKIDEIIWKHLKVLDDSGLYFDGASNEIVSFLMNEVINTCNEIGDEMLDDGESCGAWACATEFERWN